MITQSNSTLVGKFRVITEASTIGLKPGQWPDRLSTTWGDGSDFHIAGFRDGVAVYQQIGGDYTLDLLND